MYSIPKIRIHQYSVSYTPSRSTRCITIHTYNDINNNLFIPLPKYEYINIVFLLPHFKEQIYLDLGLSCISHLLSGVLQVFPAFLHVLLRCLILFFHLHLSRFHVGLSHSLKFFVVFIFLLYNMGKKYCYYLSKNTKM